LWSLLDASLPAHRDHRDDEGKHPADGGGPPAIDLGPITPADDQPQPVPSGNDASPKPGALEPGEPTPPHNESKSGIDPNVGDGGNKSADANIPEKPMNPENPATALPKPGPDPEAGKSTSDIPIFLGPSNNSPAPGSGSPSSNNPQQSGYPGDDTPCGGFLDEPLINLLSNNGGDGGDASSGAATRQDLHLFMSLTLTPSKASGTVGVVAILRTAAPAAMPLGVL
jgi:hypothetical protein